MQVRPGKLLTIALLITPYLSAKPRSAAPAPAPTVLDAMTARRHATLATLREYQYQLDVRFVVRDVDKPIDSVSSIAVLSESRSSVDWQAPDHYHESIFARRKTSHLTPIWNTIAATDIGNFQSDRIEISTLSYVSPLADDAAKYYRFGNVDTITIQGRRVFRVAIRPRSAAAPTLTGSIDIADSTFDVIALDLAVTDAAPFGLWKSMRYQQRFADVGDGHWLPAEITLTGEARLPVRVPKTPQHLSFEQKARLSGFRVGPGDHSSDVREVRIAVGAQADRAGDSVWQAPGPIPLSAAERQTWSRVDASRRAPGMISRFQQASSISHSISSSGDFFHFNRVDGAYVGVGSTWRQGPALILSTKLGYGTGSDRWQYRIGGDIQVSEAQRTWIGASYHDETTTRPSLSGRVTDRSLQALLYRRDPLDYYGERGLTVTFTTRPLDFTRLEIHFSDEEQRNLPVVTDYSLLPTNRPLRGNGAITPGRMRTISGSFTWDSRTLIRRNGTDARLPSTTWTRLMISGEVASPSLIPNDFNFGRFIVQVERHQRTFGLGLTTVSLLAGIGTGTVPPQRYFTIEGGVRALGFQGSGFHTLGDTSYAGNRIAMVSIRHDFDRQLLARSDLPLIRHLPFTVSVFGAAFGVGFSYHDRLPGDSAFRTTTVPYTEAGVALGNLLPFLAPLNVGAQFTWQLTSQATRRFQFGLDLRGP